MRDSIGGTLLFWIVLILLSVFIVFIALIIKYARIYKIKNSIVNYLERNEGVSTKEELESNLIGYGYPSDSSYKICRYLYKSKDGEVMGGYYYIELYSEVTFPLVGNFFAVNIPIKGETRNITTGTKIKIADSTNSWFLGSSSECKSCNIKTGDCVTNDA